MAAFMKSRVQTQPPAEPPSPSQLETQDTDAGQFDDQLMEILKRGAKGTEEPEGEDPLEALLKSGPSFEPVSESERKATAPLFPSSDSTEDEPSFPLPPFSFEEETHTEQAPQRAAPSLEEIMGISSLSDLEKPRNESWPAENSTVVPPSPTGDIIPDLPDVAKSDPGIKPIQDDFLKMFPGAKG